MSDIQPSVGKTRITKKLNIKFIIKTNYYKYYNVFEATQYNIKVVGNSQRI